MTTPTTDARERELDGAYERFRERVTWFYRNAPECQEARKHSFSRQADVAFMLAMREHDASLLAACIAKVEGMRWERDVEDEDHDAMCATMGGGSCESCIRVDARNTAIDAIAKALREGTDG